MATGLSVLDQSPVPSGSTAAEALSDSVALAKDAERLGYRRYWLTEHHNTASLAGSAPEVLTAAVAAATSSIRVGAGGILLPYYRPLKVAEAFRTLHALFPGRIDLGVGRAEGTDALAAAALGYGWGANGDDDYGNRLRDLIGFLRGRLDDGHAFAGVRAMPDGGGGPEPWVLSSSSFGATLAAELGLPLSFAHFVTPDFGPQVVAGYRSRFRPSEMCPEPVVNLGVSVVCADSDDEAEQLCASQDLWRLRPEGAPRGPLLPVEEAKSVLLDDLEREKMTQGRSRRIAGGPATVRSRLDELTATFGVDEVVVLTICHDPRDRLRSYELLARAFALEPAG